MMLIETTASLDLLRVDETMEDLILDLYSRTAPDKMDHFSFLAWPMDVHGEANQDNWTIAVWLKEIVRIEIC